MDLDGQGRGPYHSRSRSDGGQEGDELAAAGRRTGLSAWLSFSSRSSLREPPGGDGGAEGGEGAEEETGGGRKAPDARWGLKDKKAGRAARVRGVSDPSAASPMREEAIRRVQESIAASAPQTLEDLGAGWRLTRVFGPAVGLGGGASAEGAPASMDLRVFHAGLDQNSSEVGGGAACSVCACALAQWLVEHEGELPAGPGELDDIVRRGVGVWQQLRQCPAALAQFPDGHFDLDFALQGLARSVPPASGAPGAAQVPSRGGVLEAVPGQSFIGFLALPEATAPVPTGAAPSSDAAVAEPAEGGGGSGEWDSPQNDSRDTGPDTDTSGRGDGAGAVGGCSRDEGGGERAAAEPDLLSSLRGLLQGSLGVEDLWREMAGLAPAVFVVAWHDHFFALALRASGGAAVLDSLGSRLHDGNDSAYVIDFPAGPIEVRPYSTPGGAALPGARLEARLDEVGDGESEARTEPSGGAAAAEPAPVPALGGGAGALRYITELLAGERVRQLARELAPRAPGSAAGAPPPSEPEFAAAVERALRTLQIELHRVAVSRRAPGAAPPL